MLKIHLEDLDTAGNRRTRKSGGMGFSCAICFMKNATPCVAQIGAVIGREFSHALLAAVARKSEVVLQSALDRLTAAGLLFRQGVPPHATYLFKHALVQDAAYGTLLREPRRALHACIAESLESQFAQIAENQPELLAHHWTEAGERIA